MKRSLNNIMLAVLLASLVLALFGGLPATAQVNPTPSTNDINRANGWAHVNQIAVGIGSTTLEFVSTRSFFSCFEYRTDGDTSQFSPKTAASTTIRRLRMAYIRIPAGTTTHHL
jgi:hypothetical protein